VLGEPGPILSSLALSLSSLSMHECHTSARYPVKGAYVNEVVYACIFLPLQERLNSNYAELSGAFKTSLEGLARTVQDLHSIIK
jgi:hypothetical protein